MHIRWNGARVPMEYLAFMDPGTLFARKLAFLRSRTGPTGWMQGYLAALHEVQRLADALPSSAKDPATGGVARSFVIFQSHSGSLTCDSILSSNVLATLDALGMTGQRARPYPLTLTGIWEFYCDLSKQRRARTVRDAAARSLARTWRAAVGLPDVTPENAVEVFQTALNAVRRPEPVQLSFPFRPSSMGPIP